MSSDFLLFPFFFLNGLSNISGKVFSSKRSLLIELYYFKALDQDTNKDRLC